jgi:hypothetical protein
LLSVFLRHYFLAPIMPATAAALANLRSVLEQRFPDATPLAHRTTEQVASGIAQLDRCLPAGGFPRGRLSVWSPFGGATAILRASCYTVTTQGERAAWIDGEHMLTSTSWIDGPVLLKPVTRRAALRAAEEILRSGGFALVVLSGTDPQGQEAVRLTRAAREGGAALVSVTTAAALSSLRVSSSLDPRGYQWHRTPFGEPAVAHDVLVRVRARAMGWNAHSQFLVPILHQELRLALEPGLADRRGVRR